MMNVEQIRLCYGSLVGYLADSYFRFAKIERRRGLTTRPS